MLIPDLYTVLTSELVDGKINSTIRLNAEHQVFKGHFPGNPVTPGVCMIQIFKELAENSLKNPFFISECSNVKFMALINPEKHPILDIELILTASESQAYKLKATAKFDNTIALKLSAVLSKS